MMQTEAIIVSRDLKRAKLAPSFAYSKIIEAKAKDFFDMQLVGTPLYAAPEVWQG